MVWSLIPKGICMWPSGPSAVQVSMFTAHRARNWPGSQHQCSPPMLASDVGTSGRLCMSPRAAISIGFGPKKPVISYQLNLCERAATELNRLEPGFGYQHNSQESLMPPSGGATKDENYSPPRE